MSLSKPQTDIKADPQIRLPDPPSPAVSNDRPLVPAEDTMKFVQVLTELLESVLSKQVVDSLTYSVCSSLVASLLGLITSAAAMFNTTTVGGVLHGAVLLTQLNAFVAICTYC